MIDGASILRRNPGGLVISSSLLGSSIINAFSKPNVASPQKDVCVVCVCVCVSI